MKTLTIASTALLIGGALGFSINHWVMPGTHSTMAASSESNATNEPLYWVAPMDPNYQRDKPGKSPMGMDLIPVYAEDSPSTEKAAGTVTISPAVENNLGVKTTQVKLEPLRPQIDAVGYVSFDESTLWQTNVRTSGWVEKLYVDTVGEKVKQGDVLFTFYSPDLVKAQEELLNANRTGRKTIIQAAKQRLSALGVDDAQIKQIYRSGKAKQHIEIKAIADGVIANLNIREGGYLSPSQTVISAGPLDHVWVDVELFERQGHWVKSGSQASMKLDSIPYQTWQGRVDYVYPILDPATRTLRVRLKFDNPQGELKPNMFANVTLTPVSDNQVLTVPRSSVIRANAMSRVVLALGDGQYRSARIETGREASDRIEVLQGLELSDRVVTSAQFMLDSESSQSAELSRINGLDAPAPRAWANGQITDIMADHHMLTINHQPVEQWNWPAMVMNFTLAPSLDISTLEQGQSIRFEMEKTPQGQYLITQLKPAINPVDQVWIDGSITMLMSDFNMVTLSHDNVDPLKWKAGEQNFSVSDNFDLSPFSEGQRVRFLVENNRGEWQLKQLEAQTGEQGDTL
ncbi:putative cation efflux system transmembrane protein [Vibrio ichthyoenteri ATCC 700023]|uniref:Putative cation efflux system transmembrane protein n=1 Tax=Vibrio ichthyoenteri ATCC 700023 TaxID=870968 RepID=F9RXG0_9VIBR|nr:efflux RND transporter periplasmic adaptor subunit [Vibrio ichthyoenteri]EGU48056.1 putative cation efflux system transmembrane protein [Vibrio ichthyoenteri ATCC 700023]